MSKTYDKPPALEPPKATPDLAKMKAAAASGTVAALRHYGDGLFLWGGLERLSETIEVYQRAIAANR